VTSHFPKWLVFTRIVVEGLKGTDVGTGVGWRRRYRSSTAILCVKLATGTGPVPVFILPRSPQGGFRALRHAKCRLPFHHVAHHHCRPFSLAWGDDHRAATWGRVGKCATFASFLGCPRCLIPSVRPESIWLHNARIVVAPGVDAQAFTLFRPVCSSSAVGPGRRLSACASSPTASGAHRYSRRPGRRSCPAPSWRRGQCTGRCARRS